ncbi:MAG: hypothetical protein M0P43_01325 [Arcobacteraceae bacterium]|jgi:hypothetical protein|nr:hypothetical protein [Arcobacteraceae bacterium]MDY0327137.1 hypothetical protein [Arcobacteraceae bacterium]
MKKQNWSAIYILSLFVLGFGLVLWTIFKAVNLPVQLDKTFFDTKKGIDDKFNDMAESNKVFLNKYDIKFVYNNTNESTLDMSDLFLSQTVIQQRGESKNFLNIGENILEVYILDKNTNTIPENVDIHAMVTIASNNTNDIDLTSFEVVDNKFTKTFTVPREANWNVNGIVTVGDDKGYFFIKTNAK